LLTTIPGGAEVAGRQTLIHTTALALIALLPTPLGMAGYGYLAVAFVAGALFVATSVAFAREGSVQRARTLLFASLLYLPVLLAAMACDRVWPLG
jgi:protoheme IX farnesyltransferase